ncbi:tartrate dehydrogenase [Roseobacter sp.]|uniref:tartrate dehydrogenase n=1 Tax=Roseobacter sp. TaxID=1907202 RepID=UPI002611FB2C|nr:tartrate dehydrogenase [Roseobacter sp.]MDW3181355.1 tartrate dehydrogenase [Roseobacter sp.]
MKTYRIAAIPGDGIGKEVLPVGQRVVEKIAAKHGFAVEWTEFDWSCERYHQTGKMMPDDGIEQVKDFDSIYLGAAGYPGVPDHISLWGLLIPLRRELDQYANVRPVRLLRGITSPLAGRGPKDIDFVVVRENVEGEYSEIGGRVYQGTDREAAIQESILTRFGTDRIMDYAFELAKTRTRKKVASATKSNGIIHTMPFWDERFAAASERHPGIETSQFHIDIMTAHFVLHPDWFDVVVASNLFGDILSDLGPAVAGSIGIAPSANINPEGKFPSMFEPVHGSAPDIAGKGIANPVAAVWTAAMMLEHLGEAEAAAEIERAIETSFERDDTKTRDLGGTGDTAASEAAVLAALT